MSFELNEELDKNYSLVDEIIVIENNKKRKQYRSLSSKNNTEDNILLEICYKTELIKLYNKRLLLDKEIYILQSKIDDLMY